MSLSQRLMTLSRFEGNHTKLAAKIGTTTQSISKIVKNDLGISGKSIVAIAEAYPQLNMRWFLTGQGESGLDGVAPEVKPEDPEKELLKEELLQVYKDKTGMLEEKVKMLEREIREQAPDLAARLEIE